MLHRWIRQDGSGATRLTGGMNQRMLDSRKRRAHTRSHGCMYLYIYSTFNLLHIFDFWVAFDFLSRFSCFHFNICWSQLRCTESTYDSCRQWNNSASPLPRPASCATYRSALGSGCFSMWLEPYSESWFGSGSNLRQAFGSCCILVGHFLFASFSTPLTSTYAFLFVCDQARASVIAAANPVG